MGLVSTPGRAITARPQALAKPELEHLMGDVSLKHAICKGGGILSRIRSHRQTPSLAAVLRACVRNATAIVGPQIKLQLKRITVNGIYKRRMKQCGAQEMIFINMASSACDRTE